MDDIALTIYRVTDEKFYLTPCPLLTGVGYEGSGDETDKKGRMELSRNPPKFRAWLIKQDCGSG